MKTYEQHPDRVVEDGRFKHMMALALNPKTAYQDGLIRCITKRTGDITIKGNRDYSALYKVHADAAGTCKITEPLEIMSDKEILSPLGGDNLDFLGLEDPDIFVDEAGLLHVYFTVAMISEGKTFQNSLISLGHAEGKNLDSLMMTQPVLAAQKDNYPDACAKEVSIAPINSKGFRYNLFEGHDKLPQNANTYSTVRIAIARDMRTPWKFGDTVFHPAEHNLPWIAGHASPGPLFPKSFLDPGENKLAGIMNGCEADRHERDKTIYGKFRVGLFIYDYEHGKIEWVSPEPLIEDTEAIRITFARQFVETGTGEGILYAHVDDSFVRAYTLFAGGIKTLLP